MKGDSLGSRLKGYEQAFRSFLPHRLPVIIRVDGKAFHTATRGCKKPFDPALMTMMDEAAIVLCKEAQGAVFGFVQSDEISVLLHNYKTLTSQPWFDNQVQKIVSISASIVSSYITRAWNKPVAFDSRVFVLPEGEVVNYFIWRQLDATRNSIQMAARAVFSHKECNNKNTSELQEMLHSKGINWNDYPVGCKRGRAVVRETYEKDGAARHRWTVEDPPIFTQAREYVERRLAVEESERLLEHRARLGRLIGGSLEDSDPVDVECLSLSPEVFRSLDED